MFILQSCKLKSQTPCNCIIIIWYIRSNKSAISVNHPMPTGLARGNLVCACPHMAQKCPHEPQKSSANGPTEQLSLECMGKHLKSSIQLFYIQWFVSIITFQCCKILLQNIRNCCAVFWHLIKLYNTGMFQSNQPSRIVFHCLNSSWSNTPPPKQPLVVFQRSAIFGLTNCYNSLLMYYA